jgi:hypothetical protein
VTPAREQWVEGSIRPKGSDGPSISRNPASIHPKHQILQG